MLRIDTLTDRSAGKMRALPAFKQPNEARSANMRAIRSEGMLPEMVVRRLVHGLGFRFRLHQKDLPGKPDLVFSSRRKVIFVHGCFWHGHDCKRNHDQQSNRQYWLAKLRRNRQRDKKNLDALISAGWAVLVIWECDVADYAALTATLRAFLRAGGGQEIRVAPAGS